MLINWPSLAIEFQQQEVLPQVVILDYCNDNASKRFSYPLWAYICLLLPNLPSVSDESNRQQL